MVVLDNRLTTAIKIALWGLGTSGAILTVVCGFIVPIAVANHDTVERHERRLAIIEQRGPADHLVCHKRKGEL